MIQINDWYFGVRNYKQNTAESHINITNHNKIKHFENGNDYIGYDVNFSLKLRPVLSKAQRGSI